MIKRTRKEKREFRARFEIKESLISSALLGETVRDRTLAFISLMNCLLEGSREVNLITATYSACAIYLKDAGKSEELETLWKILSDSIKQRKVIKLEVQND